MDRQEYFGSKYVSKYKYFRKEIEEYKKYPAQWEFAAQLEAKLFMTGCRDINLYFGDSVKLMATSEVRNNISLQAIKEEKEKVISIMNNQDNPEFGIEVADTMMDNVCFVYDSLIKEREMDRDNVDRVLSRTAAQPRFSADEYEYAEMFKKERKKLEKIAKEKRERIEQEKGEQNDKPLTLADMAKSKGKNPDSKVKFRDSGIRKGLKIK